MSLLITGKLGNRVILATDSRIVDNAGGQIQTDAEIKIHEIVPGVFLGTGGIQDVCNWQAAKAPEVAAALGTSDIRMISDALDEALLPRLAQLLQDLWAAGAVDRLRGDKPLHGYSLVGLSDGVPGFQNRIFWSKNGQIQSRRVMSTPGDDLQVWGTTCNLIQGGIGNPLLWADGLTVGVERVYAEVVRRYPRAGGPMQAVEIESGGSRWLHRLPEPSDNSRAEPRAELCSDLIFDEAYGGPLELMNGNLKVRIDSTDMVKVSNTSTGAYVQLLYNGAPAIVVAAGGGGGAAYVLSSGFSLVNASGSCALSPTVLSVSGLPSSNPGAGSKQVWYDPSDGYRMKFQP